MNESNSQSASQQLADPEIAELLGDAFEAPPVPRSLLKRLDHGIEQEWGTSPRLADTAVSQLGRSLGRGTRWVRTLPLAAALSIMVAAAVILLPQGPGAYGWADLVRRLGEQTMVLVEAPEQSRWMAATDGLVTTQDDASLGLLNVAEGFQLTRAANGSQIGRRQLNLNGDRQDMMVLSLLLGDTQNLPSIEFVQNSRIVNESSEVVTHDGAEHFQLTVDVESDGFAPVSLRLLVDSETQLPSSCNVTGWNDSAQNLAFSYPETAAEELVAMNFPNELPVVDFATVNAELEVLRSSTVNKTAMADTNDTNLQLPETLPAVAIEEGSDVPKLTMEKEQTEEPTVAEVTEVTEPEIVTPRDWKAVEVHDHSGPRVTERINNLLSKLWKENHVAPADAADEEELMRRVYLDLAGRTPTVNEARSFLEDESENRYPVLVDRLLNGVDHASHLATTFRTFLIPDSVDLTAFGGVEEFDKWLGKEFQRGVSYDEIVKSLILAEGRLSRSGPLLFYSANKLDADQLAARTARVFLGTRLECAQCHDHPFESWTQDDFWGFAAFFARISRPRGTLEAASTVLQVRDVDRGEVMMPDSEDAIPPKYLDALEPLQDNDPKARRRLLASWMTSGKNPYFARATANRVWAQLFGKGIVEPLDDFGVEHPARSSELLDLLASHLINSEFRLRELFRSVVLSDAYQLSSGAGTTNEERLAWFAQMNVKTLTAEQVYDCITVATLSASETATRSGLNLVRFGNTGREAFLQQFRTPAGRQTEYMGGIPQALTLMNGTFIDGATGISSSGLLGSLAAPFFTNEERIEVLYLGTLSRRPTESEVELLRGYIRADSEGNQLREGLSDILWALLNSAEFTMNH